jgi:hypothetical protein
MHVVANRTAGGYIIWGEEVKKKAEIIRELKEIKKPEIEVDKLQRLDQSHTGIALLLLSSGARMMRSEAAHTCVLGTTDSQVYTIVLTGGPCGGKSTALATLTKHLRAQGYEVYCVPEIPTLVFTGAHPPALARSPLTQALWLTAVTTTAGVPNISTMNEEQLLAFEKQILTTQIQLEETMKKIASAMNKPTVILLDRVRAPVTTWWCAGTAGSVRHCVGGSEGLTLCLY